MSFPRHEGIFRSDGRGSCRSGARSERLHAPTHRLDEFPTGYSSAGWSPPEPASASPAEQKFTMKAAPQPSLFPANGETLLSRLSHYRGPPQYMREDLRPRSIGDIDCDLKGWVNLVVIEDTLEPVQFFESFKFLPRSRHKLTSDQSDHVQQ